MPISDYYKCQPENVVKNIMPLIEYINANYPEAVFDEQYSAKTYIPTYRLNDSYVAIGCRKHYISIYFGTQGVAEIVANETPYCRALKGCVSLSYKRAIPYDAVFKGIDKCFK